MYVLTVLYGHPTDPAAFDAHYASTHIPPGREDPRAGQLHASPLRIARRLAAALLPDRPARLRLSGGLRRRRAVARAPGRRRGRAELRHRRRHHVHRPRLTPAPLPYPAPSPYPPPPPFTRRPRGRRRGRPARCRPTAPGHAMELGRPELIACSPTAGTVTRLCRRPTATAEFEVKPGQLPIRTSGPTLRSPAQRPGSRQSSLGQDNGDQQLQT